jgi:hypothetical protein
MTTAATTIICSRDMCYLTLSLSSLFRLLLAYQPHMSMRRFTPRR